MSSISSSSNWPGGVNQGNWTVSSISPSSASSISPDTKISELSDKEKADLISMLLSLTVPLIPPQDLYRIFSSDPDFIQKLGSLQEVGSIGLQEAAITLAVADAWARSIDEIKKIVAQQENSPFNLALEAFIRSQAMNVPSSALLDAIAEAKTSPLLSAAYSQAQVDPALMLKSYETASRAIAIAILDKWIEQVEAMGKLNQEKERQKEFDLEAGRVIATNYLEALKSGQITLHSQDFTTVITAISSGQIKIEPTDKDPNNGNVPFTVMQQMFNAMPPPQPAYDYRLELSILGASMASTLAYQSVPLAAYLLKVQGTQIDDKAKDTALAKGYALAVAAMVLNPEMDIFINYTILKPAEGKSSLTDAVRQQVIAFVKIVLLASALAALYKAETGGLTPEEFAALLSGQMALPEGDLKILILKLMKQELGRLPENMRALIIQSLLDFIGTSPKIDVLTKPAKTFASLYKTPAFQPSTTQAV